VPIGSIRTAELACWTILGTVLLVTSVNTVPRAVAEELIWDAVALKRVDRDGAVFAIGISSGTFVGAVVLVTSVSAVCCFVTSARKGLHKFHTNTNTNQGHLNLESIYHNPHPSPKASRTWSFLSSTIYALLFWHVHSLMGIRNFSRRHSVQPINIRIASTHHRY
jgi:hypothetical protein